MNTTYLHSLCVRTRKDVADDFKNKLLNPIFPLTKSVVDIELEDMRASFYQKIFSKMYNIHNISEQQHEAIEIIAKKYIEVALTKGRKFAESLIKTNST